MSKFHPLCKKLESDGPMHPSANSTMFPVSPNRMPVPPPPTFASFFGQGGCTSPIKKQKLEEQQQDRRRLQLSPGGDDSSSCDESSPLWSPPQEVSTKVAPVFPKLMAFPSTPPRGDKQASSTTTPSGKRSLPTEEEEGNASEASSPFSPKGRLLMQNLCINDYSPSQTLSSVSPTPESNSTIVSQLVLTNLPSMPTFSFSPSLNLDGKDCISPSRIRDRTNTADSSVRETIGFSVGSTLGTPKRVPTKGSIGNTNSANSSPFQSVRTGQRTPIGLHRGSVFNSLPPRIYPNGRDDASVGSVADNSHACASTFTASPSPRVVPLQMIIKNGATEGDDSQAAAAFDQSSISMNMRSPLIRSLSHDADDPYNELLSPERPIDITMPKITTPKDSPLSSTSERLTLPRIKLTPRGKNIFLSPKLMTSPRVVSENGLTVLPRMTQVRSPLRHPNNIIEPASSCDLLDSPGGKAAAEMDSLLNGFESHKAADRDDKEYFQKDQTQGALGRVESEEAEMVALTQGPFQKQNLWLPPQMKRLESSSFSISGFDLSRLDEKPTLNSHEEENGHLLINAPGASPSFLPRPVPVDQNKSRSLFDSSRNPLESILRADAIAEAAKSNDPLTDEESDDDDVVLLEAPSDRKKFPFKSHVDFRIESPSFNRRAESPSFKSFMRRKSDHSLTLRGLASPLTPTIYEEFDCKSLLDPSLHTSMQSSSSHRSLQQNGPHTEGLLHKRETSNSTFATCCSLSDCESDITSPKYPRCTKALSISYDRQSMCSLMSMNSLCGLDIVHETSSVEMNDSLPVLLQPSSSSEFSSTMFKPLARSDFSMDFSMHSLGLSVDSSEFDQRDLFTPPVVGVRRNMFSPPPLRRGRTPPLL